MKRHWIWSLLIGVVVGVGIGVMVARSGHAPVPKGTPLLREFSFAAFAAETGTTNWQIIEDRIYEPFPSLALSPRIARRIVARTELSDEALDRFCTRFQQVASNTLNAKNARNTAQFDQIQDETRVIDGKPIRHRLDLPRRYYAIGDTHGVADFWYVAASGHLTVIVSLIEGR